MVEALGAAIAAHIVFPHRLADVGFLGGQS
jgi:hypothetical protein